MAANVNRTELAGNLGNDPEARYTATGSLVVTASIAVHSSYKQGEEWKDLLTPLEALATQAWPPV